MLALYREKDGVEKRFKVSKSDLKVSPIYLHKDERIEGIEKLESLDVVETLCWDGSLLYRIVPVDQEQALLLEILAHVLADLRRPRWPHLLLPSGNALPLALPPPGDWQVVA